MKPILVIVSADAEWRKAVDVMAGKTENPSPLGAWMEWQTGARRVVLFHGGWGKVAAAASAAYGIARWEPDLVVNLGTCGGFRGRAAEGEIVLAERTLIYDIEERMGDSQEALDFYTTHIDLSWLSQAPQAVRRGALVSADRDLRPEEAAGLAARFDALAGDWESGAIAWTARRFGVPVLILRGVSDVVDAAGSDTYDRPQVFADACAGIMRTLLEALPAWLDAWEASAPETRGRGAE